MRHPLEDQPRSRELPGIIGRVHYKDEMLYDESEESIAIYLRAANSALENLEEALTLAGSDFASVSSCLDFGSGHGRVLRLLQQKIHPPKITACDIDAEAIRFCAEEFGVRGLVSSTHLRDLELESYGLIWVGSVLTHVDDMLCDEMLRVLGGHLQPGGVLVYSMHGELSYTNLTHLYGAFYAEEADQILGEVLEQGYSYRPYDHVHVGYQAGAYGMTWHSEEHMVQKVQQLFEGRLELLKFSPHGWDQHHDVYMWIKRETPS